MAVFFYLRSKFTKKCNFLGFEIFLWFSIIGIIEPYKSFKKSYHGASYLLLKISDWHLSDCVVFCDKTSQSNVKNFFSIRSRKLDDSSF